MAAGNKVSLSAFAGRPKRYSDDDLDEIFDDWSQKEAKKRESKDDFARTFEEAFDIDEWNEEPERGHHHGDIREPDESTFEETLETFETLETATEEVPSREEEDDYDDSRVYDEFKEDALSDDEDSTDAYSDVSSDVQDRAAIRSGFQREFSCVDNATIQKLTLLANQTGANLDELNKFLCKELEVNGFVEEMGELKHEVVSNGFEKMEGVNWSALVNFVLPNDKKTQIQSGMLPIEDDKESIVQKDCAEQTSSSTREEHRLPNPPSWCSAMSDFADFATEEGMEIPFASCDSSIGKEAGSSNGKETEKRKRHSLLCKVGRKGNEKGGADAHVSVPAMKPVIRLKLPDGSMATVSMETAAKLTNCNWV